MGVKIGNQVIVSSELGGEHLSAKLSGKDFVGWDFTAGFIS